jgi:hypothetical protein
VPELDENAEKLQFLHEVSTNVSRFFICRHRTCGYYSYNTNWVQTKDLGHYMCPMCGNRYYPWRDQPGPHAAGLQAASKSCLAHFGAASRAWPAEACCSHLADFGAASWASPAEVCCLSLLSFWVAVDLQAASKRASAARGHKAWLHQGPAHLGVGRRRR